MSTMAHNRTPVWVIVASVVGVLLVVIAAFGLGLGADDPSSGASGTAAAGAVETVPFDRGDVVTRPPRTEARRPGGSSRAGVRPAPRPKETNPKARPGGTASRPKVPLAPV